MANFMHDVNETIDLVLIRPVDDVILAPSIVVTHSGTVIVQSVTVNSTPVTDTNGSVYPAGRAIIVWITGGTVGSKETINIKYTTQAGRVLDENINLICVEES